MGRNIMETALGGVVLLIAVGFIVFAFRTAEFAPATGNEFTARFLKVGGLEPGSDVRISGVKVGTVTSRRLDPESFEAIVLLTVSSTIDLPTDTEAIITNGWPMARSTTGSGIMKMITGPPRSR